MLFAGESGTGKTMAAAYIATTLAAPLFRCDLAAVMNKYIGESEKNLGALLDHAEAADVVLLFDEADALFGRRTEGGGALGPARRCVRHRQARLPRQRLARRPARPPNDTDASRGASRRLLHDLAQVPHHALELDDVAGDTAHIEQVIEQARHVGRLPVDDLARLLQSRRGDSRLQQRG